MIIIKNNFLSNFAGAWIFYTIFPKLPFINPKFKNIAQFAPFLGLIIGSLQSLIYLFLKNNSWSNQSSVCLCLVSGFLITGGIHTDGLMDTFDGLYAGKRKMLNAMKDSRVGSFGVQAFFIVALIQFSALSRINNNIFLVLPICLFWSRFSNLIYINEYKYLNKKTKSISHKKHWRGIKKESTLSFLMIPLIVIIYLISTSTKIYFLKYMILLIVGGFFSIIVPKILGNKVGGFNGDTCGASIVLTETIILFTYSIFL